MNQASYDLARLRVNGLISRIPAKNRYRLTSDGLRIRDLLHQSRTTDYYARCWPPINHPHSPQLRKALHTIDIHIDRNP